MSLRALSTLSTTVSSVSGNNAEVPGVTFCFTSSMNSSLIPHAACGLLTTCWCSRRSKPHLTADPAVKINSPEFGAVAMPS